MSDWRPIETAPKNGDEVLLYREDAGIFLGRWTAPIDFLTEREMERSGLDEESANAGGWFYADFVQGDRFEEPPTHWMPLPSPPKQEPTP